MAKMRDKVIHAYFGINPQIVWKVIKEKLPEIKTLVEKNFERAEQTKICLRVFHLLFSGNLFHPLSTRD